MSVLQVANIVFESSANNRIEYAGSNTIVMYEAGNEVWRANTSGFYFANSAQVKAGLGTPSIESMAIHNLSINGGMEISQENGNAVSNTVSFYPVDQKRYATIGFDCDVWQSTVTPSNNYTNSIEANLQIQDVTVGAGDALYFEEDIEGSFINKLGWGTTDGSPVTVGFWSRCSSDLTYSHFIFSSTGTYESFVKELSVTGNTWTWNCFTVPGATSGTWYSNTSVGMSHGITLTTGSTYANATANSWLSTASPVLGTTTQDNFMALGVGNTFHTTGWVILPGEHTISSADAHKFLLPYDHELQRCQRYYHKGVFAQGSAGYSSNARGNYQTIAYPTEMRSQPSISLTNITYSSTSSLTTSTIDTSHWTAYWVNNADTSCYVTFNGAFNSRL